MLQRSEFHIWSVRSPIVNQIALLWFTLSYDIVNQ
jgi:hypothetical protein